MSPIRWRPLYEERETCSAASSLLKTRQERHCSAGNWTFSFGVHNSKFRVGITFTSINVF